MFNLDFKNLKVLVQGATGREGQRAVIFMKNYHTQVVAGVTPGKGGQLVDNVPIFNTIQEAIKQVGQIDVTSLYIPAKVAKAAITEAINSKIPFIHCLTEGIPYQDLAHIVKSCKDSRVQLLGPGSIGALVVNQGRIGMLGGDNPDRIYQPGKVSIISRSGGMINEIAHYLSKNKIGLRVVIHLGAETISGSSLPYYIKALYQDNQTQIIIIFDELTHGGLDELIDFFQTQPPQKPVIIHLAGSSQKIMPSGVSFGHVDVLLKQSHQTLQQKINLLKKTGVTLINTYEEYVNKINN